MSTKPRAWETPLVELLEGVPFDARMIYELSPTECLSIPVGLLCSKAAAALRQPVADQLRALAMDELYKFQQATGCDTADQLPKPEPVGYCPAYELERLASGHNAYIRPSKFGPGALDGDVPLYTHSTAERSLK